MKCFLLTLIFFGNIAIASDQTNFNLGVDMPADGAAVETMSYLIRFQLRKSPKFVTPRGSFTLDYGSRVLGGEFNFGLIAYPFYKLREDLRPQPFLGVDGGVFMGKRGTAILFSPGGTLVAGVDFRTIKTFGLTLEANYLIYPNQRSARLWFGFFYFLP